MSSWEKHVELMEALNDDSIYEPDDRDPQDYVMEEAELHSDFWDEQAIDEYILQRAFEKAECKKSLKRGKHE